MNRKQYLTSLFNKYKEGNDEKRSLFDDNNLDILKDAIQIFPYLLAANYYYVPGFQKGVSSLSVFHFAMNDPLKKKLSLYLNIKEIRSVSSSMDSDITSIFLYDDITSNNDIDFIVFYGSKSISYDKLDYLKSKLHKVESWFKNRLKVRIKINLFSNKSRSLFDLSSGLVITIFDFYDKAIHLNGKYSYKFLLSNRITPVEFLDNKKEILSHNWLNESIFFDLPHFRVSKKELKSVIVKYMNNIIHLDFQRFHKLLYYHSLYNAKDISKYFNKANDDKFMLELKIIEEESGLDMDNIVNILFILLNQDKSVSEFKKERLKMKLFLFENVDLVDIDHIDYDFSILNANTNLMKILNFFISAYEIENNPISRLLKNNTSNIEYHNFLNCSFLAEKLVIMHSENSWGLYMIRESKKSQNLKKLFAKKSLIELLIFSIYNRYIHNIIPTIKNRSSNILDENNYFNRLKNKLMKYNISFSVDEYIKNIETRIDSIESIYVFLNFSIKNSNNIKDYTYISEQWDPLNYGYQKHSSISEVAIIIKTKSQKVYYYEYFSDESIILAIQNIFSQETYSFNENVDITINIFDVVLSASVIFRLKKLFLNAYKIFSYKNSMLLTSYNGTIYLLKKEDNLVDIIPYKDEESFFCMLKNEPIAMNYLIDEDVIELLHFSKVVKSVSLGNVDIFFFIIKSKSWIYVFDEENQFYFFKNISLAFLSNIVELALNHKKHVPEINSVELFNIEEKELNDYSVTSISTNTLKRVAQKNIDFNLLAVGSVSNSSLNLSYKINNKVFHYKEFKDKSFWKMIKFVKLSNLDKVQVTTLNTSYFDNGKRYYNFKYKLKVLEILNKKIIDLKENL